MDNFEFSDALSGEGNKTIQLRRFGGDVDDLFDAFSQDEDNYMFSDIPGMFRYPRKEEERSFYDYLSFIWIDRIVFDAQSGKVRLFERCIHGFENKDCHYTFRKKDIIDLRGKKIVEGNLFKFYINVRIKRPHDTLQFQIFCSERELYQEFLVMFEYLDGAKSALLELIM